MEKQALTVAHSSDLPLTPAAVRERADLSQSQMADLLGMSSFGYQQWESGMRRPGKPAWRLLHLIDTGGAETIDALKAYSG